MRTVTRVISAIIGILIVLPVLFWGDGTPFAVLAGIIGVWALLEFYAGSRKGGFRPNLPLGLGVCVLMIWFGRGLITNPDRLSRMMWLLPVFSGLMLISLTHEIVRQHRAPFANIGVTVLGVAYIPYLLLHLVWMRGLDTPITVWSWESKLGAWLVLFVFLTTWATDTAAYTIGGLYGRKKLAPALSQGKTVEGSLGGLALATIVGAVVGAVIHMPQPHGLILGAVVGIVGQVGDLVESAFKREVNTKDFGSIMPGHGGVLDRIDSLLFSGPMVFWYVVTFLPDWVRM